MEDSRAIEIKAIIENFAGTKPSQEALSSYVERMKFEPLTVGELSDHVEQYDHDLLMVELLPKIIVALQGISYVPEYIGANKRKEMNEKNDEVRIAIIKLVEEAGLKTRDLSSIAHLGRLIASTIEEAKTTLDNKTAEVLEHMALEKFGGTFTTKNVADYVVEVFNKSFPKQEVTS